MVIMLAQHPGSLLGSVDNLTTVDMVTTVTSQVTIATTGGSYQNFFLLLAQLAFPADIYHSSYAKDNKKAGEEKDKGKLPEWCGKETSHSLSSSQGVS